MTCSTGVRSTEVGKGRRSGCGGDGGGSGGRRFRFQSRGAGAAHGLRGADGGDLRAGLGGVPRQPTMARRSSRPTTSGTSPTVKAGPEMVKLFRPNLGEAFSRAVQARMLGAGRKPLIQSFGTEPQVVVEHCLAANRIRQERDTWLTAVMVLCGLLFLPGLLLWLLVFQLPHARSPSARTSGPPRSAPRCSSPSAAFAVLFLVKMPFTGFWALYARACVVLARSSAGSGPSGSASAPRRTCASAGTACSPAAASAPRSPRRCPAAPTRPRAEHAAPGAGQAHRRAAVQLGLLRRPQGHTRHGHPLGQLAARRGPGARATRPRRSTRSAAGTSYGRSTTSCACWSAARCNTGGFPTPLDTALDRHARRRERRRRSPGRAARTWTPTRSRPRHTGHLQQAAVRRAATGTTWASSGRCGTASWSSPC